MQNPSNVQQKPPKCSAKAFKMFRKIFQNDPQNRSKCLVKSVKMFRKSPQNVQQ